MKRVLFDLWVTIGLIRKKNPFWKFLWVVLFDRFADVCCICDNPFIQDGSGFIQSALFLW